MIKNLIFDMGGVVFDLGYEQAVSRFEEIGVADAGKYLDPAVQTGLFGRLEGGLISCEEFRSQLSDMIGKDLSHAQCEYAWKGYILALPERNLNKLDELRSRGYRMVLLSNTNPYITSWAHSAEFFRGRAMDSYFDHLYFSCDLKLMKPGEEIFRRVLEAEGFIPDETLFIDDSTRNCATAQALGIHTLCPQGNSDWTGPVEEFLK